MKKNQLDIIQLSIIYCSIHKKVKVFITRHAKSRIAQQIDSYKVFLIITKHSRKHEDK